MVSSTVIIESYKEARFYKARSIIYNLPPPLEGPMNLRLWRDKRVATATRAVIPPVDLNHILDVIHFGCMGLPQELIDRIMDILQDDLRTLTACSLTCRSMFTSTRCFIHRTLNLTLRNNEGIFIQGEKELHQKPGHDDLRFVSYAGECGILQYVQRVKVRGSSIFTPATLLPHLVHFQSLDRVHTLSIDHYDADMWANHNKICFSHFYPTLTSLALRSPSGNHKLVLQFALQFPNLENLCLESPTDEEQASADLVVADTVDASPPLRGRFRLADANGSTSLVSDLQGKIKFRSVEIGFVQTQYAQDIVDGCGPTLETLIIVSNHEGARQLTSIRRNLLTFFFLGRIPQAWSLDLSRASSLCRIVLRIGVPEVPVIDVHSLCRVISSIKPLEFSEFVFELDGRLTNFSERFVTWNGLDWSLNKVLEERGDFRVIFRIGRLYDEEDIRRYAVTNFPALSEKGRVYFEDFRSIENFWC